MLVQQPQGGDCWARMLIVHAVLARTGSPGLVVAERRWAVDLLQQARDMLLVVPGGLGRQALDWVLLESGIAEEPRRPCWAVLGQESRLLETDLVQ
jgi:hypothetical protein